MTQLLYSDAIVDFLAAFARDNEHRPEILLSFGFVPKVESQVGLINWLIQDPGNAAVAEEQALVAESRRQRPGPQADADGRPVQAGDRRRPYELELRQRHPLPGTYRVSAAAFGTCFARMLAYWSPPGRRLVLARRARLSASTTGRSSRSRPGTAVRFRRLCGMLLEGPQGLGVAGGARRRRSPVCGPPTHLTAAIEAGTVG